MTTFCTNTQLHNEIAKTCIEQFYKLPKCGKPKEGEWTILSCIVSEKDDKFNVVALGTGSKCIGQSKMSEHGDILNDSHAEIMCRRAFLRYIYENMIHCPKNSLIAFDPDKQVFNIRNCKFHFFSTHVPCGDAAIFPKQDEEYFGDLIPTSNIKRKCQDTINITDSKKLKLENDIFRTGAKCLKDDDSQDPRLDGGDYHVTGVVRTKPGRGDPTLSVSCSDKMAKWSHLGVQGALLSILLCSPIYFSSITIAGGTPFNDKALKRALFERLGEVELQQPYCRREIVVGQSQLTFPYGKSENKKPSSTSTAWLHNVNDISNQTEVAVEGRRQGVTKKQIKSSAGALQISKINLFKKFISVVKQYSIQIDSTTDISNLSYKEAKLLAKDYQKAWLKVKKRFKSWTVKSENLLHFRA